MTTSGAHEERAVAPSDDRPHPLADRAWFPAEALSVGERIELRRYRPARRLAAVPLMVPVGQSGVAVLFHYGVVVFFGGEPADREALLAELHPFVHPSHFHAEREQVDVRVDPEAQEGMVGEEVVLRDHAIERLQLVATTLATSVILAIQEEAVAAAMDRIEPFAWDLRRSGRPGTRTRELLRYIGESLQSEHQIVGRVEVGDEPEVLWERPDLQGLHVRLTQEFEIRERHGVLERKLDLISRTARTMIDLLYTRRTLRVEWYIVILIVVEIVITLVEHAVA
jgi:uncharacterized Rmd1/YagE family protein